MNRSGNKSRSAVVALASALVLVLAAGAVQARKPVSWVLDLSGDGKFFDLPFPTELRRTADGGIKTDGFHTLLRLKMFNRTMDAVSTGYGYSTGTTIYFRFSGPIEQDNLPGAEASLAPGSPLFLIDIDPASPDRGRRFPIQARFYKSPPRYMPACSRDLLAFMPVPGFVLRENTLYAAGVMSSLGGHGGDPLGPSPALEAISQGRSPEGGLGGKALSLYGPALEALSSMGISASDLAALTVFRTGDPTARLVQLFDGVKDMPPPEWETPLARTRDYDLYTVLEGAVMMPQFQDGTPPYGHGKGGRLQFDNEGRPIIQRMERVPVAFSIPKGKMPARGFPITIYIHGTAGVSTQFIDRGEIEGPDKVISGFFRSNFGDHGEAPPGTGPALIYAQHGIAGVGAAQQHAGERGGLEMQLFYYNFPSPEALRDNMLQASAEASILLRLVQKIEIDPGLCPGTETGGGPVKFDPKLVFGTGQSLGSLILGPWGGVETDVRLLIPAGNGAYWSLFMSKANPLDMKTVKRSGKGFTELAGLDLYHPLITMLATVLAPGDPFAYQPHYFMDPLPGRAPKHVWASFGLYDHYFPPASQNAAILCMGLDVAGPVLEPSTREALELGGLKVLDYPVTRNKKTPAGKVTAVAVQFPQHGQLDGHHVNYQRDDAKQQYGCFLESMVEDGVPTAFEPKQSWDAPCGP